MAATIELRERTKAFALRIIKLSRALPASRVGDVIGRQVLRSETSVGANWREATRASSKRHFISTTDICIREAAETLYWLELLSESELVKPSRLSAIMDECNQLLAIFTATAKRAKSRLRTLNRAEASIQHS